VNGAENEGLGGDAVGKIFRNFNSFLEVINAKDKILKDAAADAAADAEIGRLKAIIEDQKTQLNAPQEMAGLERENEEELGEKEGNELIEGINEMVSKIDQISKFKIQSDALKTLLNNLRQKCLQCKNKKDFVHLKEAVEKAKDRFEQNLTEDKLITLLNERRGPETLVEGLSVIDDSESEETNADKDEVPDATLEDLAKEGVEFSDITAEQLKSLEGKKRAVIIQKLTEDQEVPILKDMSGEDLKTLMGTTELVVDAKTKLLISWVDNNNIKDISKWSDNLFNDASVSITSIKGNVKATNPGLAKALDRFKD
jgi:hypothetical protein